MTNPTTTPQLHVTVTPSAPEELQRIGQQYWQHTGNIRALEWTFSSYEIDCSSWASNLRFAAGAGVTATLTGYSCVTCNGPLECTTRSKVADALRGKATKCRHCTNNFTGQVNHVLDPDSHAQRIDKVNRERREREAQEDKRRHAAQLEQRRQAALKQRRHRQSDGTIDQAIKQASILLKIGTLLWLQRHMGLNLKTSLLEHSLINSSWEKGLLTVSPYPQTADFEWDEDDPANLTGLKHVTSLDLGFSSPKAAETEQERVYTMLLTDLTHAPLTDEEVSELRWLLPRIAAMEAINALQAVEIDYGWYTSTVRLTIAQRDAIKARAQQTAHVATMHDIVIAMQSAVYHAHDKHDPDEWLDDSHITNSAVHIALHNLQMLQTGNIKYRHRKANTAAYELSSLTSLIFMQCLNLNPLSSGTTPQAIQDVLAARELTTEQAETVELTLDPDTLSQAKEYAHSNNLTLGTIIENALKSYFT